MVRMIWAERIAGPSPMVIEGFVLFENKQEYHCGLDMDTRRRVAEKKPERNRGSDG